MKTIARDSTGPLTGQCATCASGWVGFNEIIGKCLFLFFVEGLFTSILASKKKFLASVIIKDPWAPKFWYYSVSLIACHESGLHEGYLWQWLWRMHQTCLALMEGCDGSTGEGKWIVTRADSVEPNPWLAILTPWIAQSILSYDNKAAILVIQSVPPFQTQQARTCWSN